MKKKYNIILADPPWSYSDKRDNPTKNNPNGAGGATKYYNCMKIEDLKKLNVERTCRWELYDVYVGYIYQN